MLLMNQNNKKKSCHTKNKRDWKKSFWIRQNLSELKKYYDYVDIKYNGIRDVRILFSLSIDEDYYRPIIANDAINSNYIEYECKGYRGKILPIKDYLYMIIPYLVNIINDHKTQGEWRIQLAVLIRFIF